MFNFLKRFSYILVSVSKQMPKSPVHKSRHGNLTLSDILKLVKATVEVSGLLIQIGYGEINNLTIHHFIIYSAHSCSPAVLPLG